MKILILGASGMAGHIIYDRLRNKHNVIGTTRNIEDSKKYPNILFFDALRMAWIDFFNTIGHFDVVINCIGCLVSASEKNPEIAIRINTDLPKYLESFYEQKRTRVIHLSTDCVFDGKVGGYTVNCPPNEMGVYGKTKASGEIINNKDLTIRTSIIGLELQNECKPNSSNNSGLLHWFLSNKKGAQINGYRRCYWSGISTIELADAVEWYLEKPHLHGLHQVSRSTKISKYSLLILANSIFDMGFNILPFSEKEVDKSLVGSEGSFNIKDTYSGMLSRVKENSEKTTNFSY